MRFIYGIIFLLFFYHSSYSVERTGLLLIGELNKPDSSYHHIEWVSTSVIATIDNESMVIKPANGLIDLLMGKIDSISMKGNPDTKFDGGGATDKHSDKQGEGIRGINLLLANDKNGYYHGFGNVFYPQDSHDVQVILFLNPLK